MRIARRDVVEVGGVELTVEEDVRLAEALRHIEQAAKDLRRWKDRLTNRPRPFRRVASASSIRADARMHRIAKILRAEYTTRPDTGSNVPVANIVFSVTS